jgi:hypothetical protein
MNSGKNPKIRRKATEVSTLFLRFSAVTKFLHPKYFIMKGFVSEVNQGKTYSNDSRIIWHGRCFVLLETRVLLDSKVLHVTAAKDDVLVYLIRWRYLFLRLPPSPLGAE